MTTFDEASYYLGDRSQPWQVPSSIAGLTAELDALIQASTTSGTVVVKTLNLTAKVGIPGQILAETVEIIVEADGNTISFKDNAGFVLEQVTEATGSAAAPFLFTVGSAILGFTPPGWMAVTVAVVGSVLYSVLLEDTVEQIIELTANTVDSDFKLVSASGEVLGGVWYRDGLLGAETIQLTKAISDLLAKNSEGFPLAQEGMNVPRQHKLDS